MHCSSKRLFHAFLVLCVCGWSSWNPKRRALAIQQRRNLHTTIETDAPKRTKVAFRRPKTCTRETTTTTTAATTTNKEQAQISNQFESTRQLRLPIVHMSSFCLVVIDESGPPAFRCFTSAKERTGYSVDEPHQPYPPIRPTVPTMTH